MMWVALQIINKAWYFGHLFVDFVPCAVPFPLVVMKKSDSLLSYSRNISSCDHKQQRHHFQSAIGR